MALSAAHLQHTTFPIPATISDAEAACVEPIACVLRAARRTGLNGLHSPHSADNNRPEVLEERSVLVVGLGFIGLLAARVYAQAGWRVLGVDRAPERLSWAQENGSVPEVFHAENNRERLQTHLKNALPTGGVDVVFLTAVTESSLAMAMASVRDGGMLMIFTSAAAPAMLDPTALYFREISVMTSYSPTLANLRDVPRESRRGALMCGASSAIRCPYPP